MQAVQQRMITKCSSSSFKVFCKKPISNIKKNNLILKPNPKQLVYQNVLRDPTVPLVISTGPAGTGKTLIACNVGLEHLQNNEFVDKVIITRPVIPVGQDLGYLPGDIHSKMHPWLIPIYDSFSESIDARKLQLYMETNAIEICPLSYIRGRTFHNAYIVADEMQNSTSMEMKTLLTRIGKNTKLVITGDLEQCDIGDNINGLEDLMSKLDKKKHDTNLIKNVEFDIEDVERSDIVKHILEIYE